MSQTRKDWFVGALADISCQIWFNHPSEINEYTFQAINLIWTYATCPPIRLLSWARRLWMIQCLLEILFPFSKKTPDANPKIRFFISRQLFFHFLKIFFEKTIGFCISESLVERHFAYSTTIFSYSTGECSYSTGIRARAPDPNPSETPAVTSKVIQSCPKATKTSEKSDLGTEITQICFKLYFLGGLSFSPRDSERYFFESRANHVGANHDGDPNLFTSGLLFSSGPPKVIKSHKKWSHGHPKTLKMCPKIIRIPISAKNWFLQHLSHQMLVSGAPDVQIQTLKSFKKVTWKSARTKNMYVDPRSPKSYENGVPKTKQNRKNTKPGPQDLFSNAPRYPWIVPWSPRVQNGGRRHTRK